LPFVGLGFLWPYGPLLPSTDVGSRPSETDGPSVASTGQPSTVGLAVQYSSTVTFFVQAKHAAVAARQQGVGSGLGVAIFGA